MSTVLTRKELYDRVWTEPMQKLGKDFGLSDVGLAKTCRRYAIPVPLHADNVFRVLARPQVHRLFRVKE